jgi:hypothetical protein
MMPLRFPYDLKISDLSINFIRESIKKEPEERLRWENI